MSIRDELTLLGHLLSKTINLTTTYWHCYWNPGVWSVFNINIKKLLFSVQIYKTHIQIIHTFFATFTINLFQVYTWPFQNHLVGYKWHPFSGQPWLTFGIGLGCDILFWLKLFTNITSEPLKWQSHRQTCSRCVKANTQSSSKVRSE